MLDEFLPYLREIINDLSVSGREFIVCADRNIGGQEIDLNIWKIIRKNSGFVPEGHAWLTRAFDERNGSEVYRRPHPDATG